MPALAVLVLVLTLAASGAAAPAPDRAEAAPAAAVTRLPGPRPSSAKRDRERPAYDGSTLLVKFAGSAGARGREGVLRRHGLAHARGIPGTDFVVVETGGRDPRELVGAVAADPAVEVVQLNHVRRALETPNDTLWGKPAGQAAYLRTVRLPEAWDRTHGSADVTIAVVDTGVDAGHPDLAGRVLPGRDFVNGDTDAADDEGHGTLVAGVAAAKTGNASGVAGAAWTASVLPVKVLDEAGGGTDADIAAGIVWAADQGAEIVNLSLGGPGEGPVLRDAIAYAVGKGSFVVAAAGNDAGPAPSYPAAYDAAFAVGATDASGDAAWFSNHGWWVDLAAPGIDVLGPVPAGPGPDYAVASGTSLSAPLVAGAAALVLAQQPSLSPAQVGERLRASARDAGPRGSDRSYGAGVLDAAAAVGAPKPPRAAQPRTDANGSPDRARALAPGAAVTDEAISPEGDVDWFFVDVAGASTLQLVVEPAPFRPWVPRALEHDPLLELYGPDLRKLVETDEAGAGVPEQLSYQASAGRYYLRVSNYGASRTPPYTAGVSIRAPEPDRFAAPQQYPTGSWPENVAVGDVTGDGRNDVLLTTGRYLGDELEADNKLWLYEQDADGWLRPPARVSSPTGRVGSLALADFDRDGKTDVAAAGAGIFFQRGGTLTGAVAVHEHLTVAGQVEAAEMTGDGRPDLVVNRGDSGVTLLTNGASGWTSRPVTTALGYRELELGDVTGDGRRDVVGIRDNALDVLAQNADGSYAAARTYTPASTSGWAWLEGLEVADVTGDGRLDAVVAFGGNRPESRLNVFRQNTLGAFDAPVVHAVDDMPEPVEAADVNGDGRQDVVTLHGGWQRAGVFLQATGGTLTSGQYSRLPYASHYEADGLAVGDVTGDGAPDLAIADHNHGLVVLRQLGGNWPAALPLWARETAPRAYEDGVATTSVPSVRFGRAVSAATVNAASVQLVNADTGAVVPATVSFDGTTARLAPQAPLAAATPYRVRVQGVRDLRGATFSAEEVTRFTTASVADATAPDTVLVLTPPAHTTDTRARFHFASTEPGSTYECRLDSPTWRPCTTAFFEASVPQLPTSPYGYGVHTFVVRAVDGAGNVDATPATYSWEVHDNAYPRNNFWANGDVVVGATGSVSGSTLGAYSDEDEPTHAGNAAGASVWFVWTAPASGPVTFETTGSAFDTLLAVYRGAELRSLVEVAADDDAGGGGASRLTFDAAAGTEYLVALSGYTDGYYAAAGAYTLRWSGARGSDVTPPSTALTAPVAGAFVAGTVQLQADAADDAKVVKVEFLVDGAVVGWDRTAPYSTYWHTMPRADGPAVVRSRAIDSSGNERLSAAVTVEVDNVGPDTTITSGPPAVSSSPDATFAFTASEAGATFRCSLDGATAAPCTSPRAYTGLSEGYHRFQVWAVDARGHWDETPASHSWEVRSRDSTPPLTTITQKPEGWPNKSTSATFAFTANEPATFLCRLDQGAFEPCTSPKTYSGLAGGHHVFQVEAVDTAGNREGYGPTWSWTIYQDNFAAALRLPSAGGTISETTSFATKEAGEPNHAGNGGGKSIWYRFLALRDGTVSLDTRTSNFDTLLAVYRGTSVSALTLVGSNDNAAGLTTSAVQFTAAAGTEYRIAIDGRNGSSGTAYLNWSAPVLTPVEDTTPPTVSLSGPSSEGVSGTVPISAEASDAGGIARVEFLVAGVVVATDTTWPYSTTWNTTTRPDGLVVIAARALDNAGNAATASRSLRVDNTEPDTTITSGPPALTESTSASFTFYASESPAWFQCSLDGAEFWGCDTPKSYSGLSLGTHTFRVRAVDGVNLTESTPATYTWKIVADATPPETSITSGPSGTVTATSAAFEFASSEPGSTFECRLDAAAWAACTSPRSYSSLAVATHTFEVRARDAAGNVDPTPAARMWTIVPPPANDLFANAAAIAGASGSVSGSTVGAGREQGEPYHHGASGIGSVWYRWTAPASGTAVFDTVGSSFDTVLAAYSGSSLATLTALARDDDGADGVTSRISFAVTANTMYHVAVDGRDTGPIALNWSTKASEPGPANLVGNGSFEAGLAGWSVWQASASLVPGVEGALAARVTVAGDAPGFAFTTRPHPVAVTVAGRVYVASARVRSETPGRRVCLVLREWSSPSTVLPTARSCVVATGAWQAFPELRYTTQTAGGSLELYTEQAASPGESHDLDAVRLVIAG